MPSPHARVSLRSYDGRESLHAHDFHQVVLPVAGAMDMRLRGAADRLDGARGVLVPCGVEHGFRAGGESRFVVLDLPVHALPDGIVAAALSAPFFAIDAGLNHLARYLSCEASDGDLDEAAARHAVGLMAGALGRRLGRSGKPGGPVARALAVMHERHAHRLSVGDLARAAGLGPSRFHEQFRCETGRTPADYLADLRLDRATDLLRGSDLSIAEVAIAVGFSEQSALTRCLRRRRGVTPAMLRRGR